MKIGKIILKVFLIVLYSKSVIAQKASITEEQLSMKTYMFSDPSPIPQIGRLYPYSRFDGYTDKGEDKLWKMVVLENEYIKVYVCPDIGGKVYGAIEKSTGKEFLYFNHTVKFRDVAMRGAWTSGGLEYNFGDIGHIPTCATPVDYRMKENEDGSVSCIVGALDLPSRTNWNVEIRLPKDKAYFETKATWSNNTSLPVTYYHWMNAAAKADGNLEFLYPGGNYIGHGGEVGGWPNEGGRDIKFYEKNNFGVYKSYHVMNAYSDFFGGYYHDDDFGFGHYSSYDDKPGKKIWIWGLSDQGMIWEDLLTDTDGQYVEYQSGKLFNQAANSSTFTPFKHREFSAYDTDVMKEYWFPLKETGGMVAASKFGVLNVEREGDKVTLILSALQHLDDQLEVSLNGKILLNTSVELSPLQLFTESFIIRGNQNITVNLGDRKLYYSSGETNSTLERPTLANKNFDWNSSYGLYTQALELEKQRRYPEALKIYLKSYEKEPGFVPTLNRLATSYFRMMDYNTALKYTDLALGIDTYDSMANYNFGLVHSVLGNLPEAKSGFSIASHSVSTRSASYSELAKIFINENDFYNTQYYLEKALAFNKYNSNALEMKALLYRKKGKIEKAVEVIKEISELDASSSFVSAEQLFLKTIKLGEFKSRITNELPYETYLELALKYRSLGCTKEAIQLLEIAPKNALVLLWLANLSKEKSVEYLNQALELNSELVFPHRVESAEMLELFVKEYSDWKLKYYLGLIYWNKGLIQKAKQLMLECKEDPETAVFYLSKATLFYEDKLVVAQSLNRAFQIDSSGWRVNMAMINHYLEIKNYEEAAKLAKKYSRLFPENDRFGLYYAKALMGLKSYEKCISFLNSFEVLPYEGATEGRTIYHEACIRAAFKELKKENFSKAIKYADQAKLWPKNLGVGKHYDVDERLDNYIIAYSVLHLKKVEKQKAFENLTSHSTPIYLNESSKLLLQLWSLRQIGEISKADAILKRALEKEPKNVYLKWVNAKYNNENSEKIKDSILNAPIEIQAYDTKFVDVEFGLLLDLLEIVSAHSF
jgi:tetratricopeptide (TPR) repeat protein